MTRGLYLLAVLAMGACGSPQQHVDEADPSHPVAAASGSASGADGSGGSDKSAQVDKVCVGSDLNLDEALSKPACISAAPLETNANTFGSALEATLLAQPTSVDPGGHVELTLVLRNKGKTDLPLKFKVDPFARFLVEVYDSSHRRADAPTGDHPPPPKDYAPPPEPDAKLATVVLKPNGTARVSVPWDAVKTVWAPEKLKKGTPAGGGFPRKPAGPLPKGVYTAKVIPPFNTVFDGFEPPSVDLAIGNVELPKKVPATPAK
jgi:hypothetical protein